MHSTSMARPWPQVGQPARNSRYSRTSGSALVATARARGWDAERALRERVRALTAEIREAEAPGTHTTAPLPGSGHLA